jgi:hypothetical protein
MKLRVLAIFLLMGHPLLFGMYFCIAGMLDGKRDLATSLIAETFAALVCIGLTWTALVELSRYGFSNAERNEKMFVVFAILLCMALAFFNLSNADTSGLFSKGGSRLDFYFANDWFRRLVTFSVVPLVVASYYSANALLSPQYRGKRRVYAAFLFMLLVYSLLAGSKGAAVLLIATALPFVFPVHGFPIAKIVVALLIVTSMYLALFLSLTTQTMSLASIAMRFYLSIDISILLTGGQGTAAVIADRLGDVWIEVFRNLGALGVRVAEQPIGALVQQIATGSTVLTAGSNCRYASLLLLYPDRLDFLLLFPVLVVVVALLLGDIFKMAGMQRAALVAIPCFVFQSFQDAYWFAGHVVPVLLVFTGMRLAKVASRGSIRRTAHAA